MNLVRQGYYHLCAFVPGKMRLEIEDERSKPWNEYYKRCAQWAKKSKGYLMYDPFTLWDKNGAFVGNAEQNQDVVSYCNEFHESKFTEKAFNEFFKWKIEQNKLIMKEYEKVEPAPKFENMDFHCQFNAQLEASEKQHAWILSLPDDSPIRRVYFAAMRLFESWKRYTYIRDTYFNMTCRGTATRIKGRIVEYSHHAGHAISETLFKKHIK